MKWHVRIVVIITVLSCMLCMMPLSAFAVDPEVIEVGETAGALIFDIYGAANNTSLAYDSIQAGPALTEIITLYQEAQAEVGGDPVSMTALGTALLAAGAVAVVYDATDAVYNLVLDLNYDNFGEFYQDFNQGWDYILSDIAELTRDSVSGLFNWEANNNVVDPVPVYQLYSYQIDGKSVAKAPASFQSYNQNNTNYNYVVNVTNDTSDHFILLASKNGYGYLFLLTFTPNSTFNFSTKREDSNIINNTNQTFNTNNKVDNLYYYNLLSNFSFTSANIPDYAVTATNYSGMIRELFGSGTNKQLDTTATGINIAPNPLYVGDPINDPLEITVPNPASPMPQNAPLRIGTDIVVDPEMLPESIPANPVPGVAYPITDPTALNDIIPDAWDQTVAGIEVDPDAEFEPADTPSDPGDVSEVYVPFLPITLPSFNFHLSNIWHYVRTWVASLASWFTLMFQIWSQLPYAIVVPVYATAVIVIVLGMYKRFFM